MIWRMKWLAAPEGAPAGGGGDWRGALPEELRGAESMKKFNDVGALAKSYLELEQLQGSSIRIPGPDAGEDARKQFLDKLTSKVPELVLLPTDAGELGKVKDSIFARLGRPKDETGYRLPALAPGVTLDEKALRSTAFGLKLTQDQFEELVKASAGEFTEQQKIEGEATKALKTKWGAAYDERVAAARAAAEKLGLTDDEAKAIGSKDLERWYTVAEAVTGTGEGARQGSSGGSGTPIPAEAMRLASEIRSNPGYFDSSHPQHAHLVKEHNRLMQLAYPEEK